MSSTASNQRVITYAEAIREATYQEMGRDEGVFVLGQGVDDTTGMFGSTKDLHQDFGRQRNMDTPLSEDAMVGVAIGAALAGMRPINVHQRMDFVLLCMNQLINIAAKSSYMFGGAVKVPIVVRAIVGRSWGQGAQHSQALHSFFMHIPGLKVVAPTTPHDAKGCMIAAIRDDNPVIMVEHRMLFGLTGIVPEEPYEVPFGQARVLGEGDDVTIVAIAHMVVEALRAHTHLAEVGISAEVVDPVILCPLDLDRILASVQKTRRLLVVDNGWTMCGASAEIIACVVERLQDLGKIRMARMGFAPVPCPTTKPLENLFYPDAGSIASKAHSLVRGGEESWTPEVTESREVVEFKGPF